MTKAVLDSSVIIALSHTGYLDHLENIFTDPIIPQAVFNEICIKGHGLIGDRELRKAVNNRKIRVMKPQNNNLVEALIDPLGIGEAEAIALAIEENTDYLILDDRLARRKALNMRLPVIGTIRVLKMMYNQEVLESGSLIASLNALKEIGFRISDQVLKKATET